MISYSPLKDIIDKINIFVENFGFLFYIYVWIGSSKKGVLNEVTVKSRTLKSNPCEKVSQYKMMQNNEKKDQRWKNVGFFEQKIAAKYFRHVIIK